VKRIEGRVAVVTGAASGIGRATAIRLADRGCALALADIDADGLASIEKELASRSVRVSTHLVDVSSREAMGEFAESVEAIHDAAHILINNAGVVIAGTFDEQKLDDLEWLLGINYWGVVYGCHYFLPLLRRQDEAHIVNLSSMFGFLGLPSQSGYCATKAAVRALSESLHVELQSDGIGVSSIHPGCIDTSIVRAGRMEDEESRAEVQAFFDRRGASPDVVAGAILKAIDKNKLRVRVRAESVLTDWAKRLFPVGIHRQIARRWRKEQAARTH
jgi:NAD(P)-dependent dehydrogenase (short-subunit alcohol dehydrogenase family)